MTLSCQTCGAPLSEYFTEDLSKEYVAHHYPDGIGRVTDYYCDPECAAVAFSSSSDSDE